MGNVGLIGLGRLGSAVAARLIAAGFTVEGHDVDPARLDAFVSAGGHPARPPAVDRLILCVPNHAIVRDLCGALPPPVRIILDLTNATPEESVALAAELALRGIHYLDAPVCEWHEVVRARGGKVVCGGDSEAVAACRDIFEAFAQPFVYAGPSGAGTRLKRSLEQAASS